MQYQKIWEIVDVLQAFNFSDEVYSYSQQMGATMGTTDVFFFVVHREEGGVPYRFFRVDTAVEDVNALSEERIIELRDSYQKCAERVIEISKMSLKERRNS